MIQFPISGSGTSGTGLATSFTLTIPATVQVDDLLLLSITCKDSVGDPIVTDDDTGGNTWAKLLSGNNGSSLGAVYWKRATSATASKTITVNDNASDATTAICGALLVVRSGVTTVTPYSNESYESNASTDESHAGFTPPEDGCAIFLVVFNATNDIEPSAQACTDPGALTSGNAYGESTASTDCSVEIAAGIQSGTLGATGTFTWTQVDAASMSIVFAIRPALSIDLTSYAIGPAEAFGSATMSQETPPQTITLTTSIDTAEEHGTTSVVPIVAPGAIDSTEALDTPRIQHTITYTGIDSGEAWDSPRIQHTITFTGIDPEEAWGAVTVTVSQPISNVGALETAEALGTASVVPLVAPGSILTAEDWGTPIMVIAQAVSGAGAVETVEALPGGQLNFRLFVGHRPPGG